MSPEESPCGIGAVRHGASVHEPISPSKVRLQRNQSVLCGAEKSTSFRVRLGGFFWSRRIAIEVLEPGSSQLKHDPSLIYLELGIRMGGHGNLGISSTFPDRFAGELALQRGLGLVQNCIA